MPTIVAVIVGVFAILSSLASVAAFFKANLAEKIITTLKESNAALTEQAGIQKEQIAHLTSSVARLTSENVALQTYVSGTEAVKELAQIVGAADKGRAQEHHDMMAAIQTMPVIITAHHEEVMAAIAAAVHTHPGASA